MSKFARVEILVKLPEVEATKEEIEEFLKFSLKYTSSIRCGNPLAEYDFESYEFKVIE